MSMTMHLAGSRLLRHGMHPKFYLVGWGRGMWREWQCHHCLKIVNKLHRLHSSPGWRPTCSLVCASSETTWVLNKRWSLNRSNFGWTHLLSDSVIQLIRFLLLVRPHCRDDHLLPYMQLVLLRRCPRLARDQISSCPRMQRQPMDDVLNESQQLDVLARPCVIRHSLWNPLPFLWWRLELLYRQLNSAASHFECLLVWPVRYQFFFWGLEIVLLKVLDTHKIMLTSLKSLRRITKFSQSDSTASRTVA